MRNFRLLSISFFSLFICLSNSYAQNFYGAGIQEIRIDLPYKNWDVKLDSLKKVNPDARLLGAVIVNGTRYDSVGVRYKGNSSYYRSRNETSKKLPINIKLDFKNKSQQIKEGYTSIKLSNGFLDPGFIRDPLSYEVIRKYMPAPQCNFSKVFMNGKPFGLYINTESIDHNFIKKHYGTTTGHLVKCDPDNWQRVRSQNGCPKGENASLAYLNDSPGCYDAFYEVDEPAAWKVLLNLIKVLNKTPDKIETVLNVDQTLWMLALNNVMVNLDSYNGSLSHNYYLWFDSTNIAHPLIWDLNMSFGGWRRNFSFVEMKDEELIQYQPLAEIDNVKRPLISKLLKNPLYRKIYIAHLGTIVNDYLVNGDLMKRAQAMMKEIEPAVKQDTLKLYSFTDFQQALDKTMHNGADNVIGMRQLMDKRTQYLQKHPLLNKAKPLIADTKYQKDGEQVTFSAKFSNAKAAYVFYRNNKGLAFKRVAMKDVNADEESSVKDGIYTATVNAADVTQYYFAAESEEAALTLPERASFEFFEVK